MNNKVVNPAVSVPADDRLTDDEFVQEEVPESITGLERHARQVFDGRPSAAALERLWTERDAAYAASETTLTVKEIKIIRQFRVLEVRTLSPSEQVNSGLAVRAMTWRPER